MAIASRTYLGAVGPIEGSAGRSSIVAVVALLLGGIVLLASRRHSVAMGSLVIHVSMRLEARQATGTLFTTSTSSAHEEHWQTAWVM